jgi:hypothetical protein
MVEADCQQVDCSQPRDVELDSLTFLAYLKSRSASETAIANTSVWTHEMLGQEPQDVSPLYFLNYCKSGGGLLQIRSDREHGAQYLRVCQGTQNYHSSSAGRHDSTRKTRFLHLSGQQAEYSCQVLWQIDSSTQGDIICAHYSAENNHL